MLNLFEAKNVLFGDIDALRVQATAANPPERLRQAFASYQRMRLGLGSVALAPVYKDRIMADRRAFSIVYDSLPHPTLKEALRLMRGIPWQADIIDSGAELIHELMRSPGRTLKALNDISTFIFSAVK
jgi:hypothetical protein